MSQEREIVGCGPSYVEVVGPNNLHEKEKEEGEEEEVKGFQRKPH